MKHSWAKCLSQECSSPDVTEYPRKMARLEYSREEMSGKNHFPRQNSCITNSLPPIKVRAPVCFPLIVDRFTDMEERFIIGKELGKGTYGVVRACYDRFTHESLACKSVDKSLIADSATLEEFRAEIAAMVALRGHVGVIQLKSVHEDLRRVHLVMEICTGGELFDLCVEKGRFKEVEAQFVIRQLSETLVFCHSRGIVHRDVKPENILLVTKGANEPGQGVTDGLAIKLADFGMADFLGAEGKVHGCKGSPYYIAPEVLTGKAYGKEVDVWSVGVVMYILLSGCAPFAGETDEETFRLSAKGQPSFEASCWKAISEPAKDLCKRLLTKDPVARITLQQALEHPWLAMQSQAGSVPAAMPFLRLPSCSFADVSWLGVPSSRFQVSSAEDRECQVASPCYSNITSTSGSPSPFPVGPSSAARWPTATTSPTSPSSPWTPTSTLLASLVLEPRPPSSPCPRQPPIFSRRPGLRDNEDKGAGIRDRAALPPAERISWTGRELFTDGEAPVITGAGWLEFRNGVIVESQAEVEAPADLMECLGDTFCGELLEMEVDRSYAEDDLSGNLWSVVYPYQPF